MSPNKISQIQIQLIMPQSNITDSYVEGVVCQIVHGLYMHLSLKKKILIDSDA
jgi:hypothetical protein